MQLQAVPGIKFTVFVLHSLASEVLLLASFLALSPVTSHW